MKTALYFAVTIWLVVTLSFVSANIWGGKPETLPENFTLKLSPEMTVKQFIQSNNLEKPFAKKLLELSSPADLEKSISSFGTPEQIQKKYIKSLSLKAESESKNWFKIPLKFALWLAFLLFSFFMLKGGRINAQNRKWMYAAGFAIFGIALGADPSPMGTVKDSVYLYGKSGAIFPPRLVALSIFLLTVLLANKFICSWGCQLGTLQDFIFRLGRNKKDTAEGVAQYKVPFAISNGVRVLFFIAMFYTAFAYGTDLFHHIDGFKIFKPAMLTMIGIGFIGIILLLSLFTYRPWCSFVCPFGLVGWIAEKGSMYKIKVNYDTCIACGKCSDSCPSPVMDAILKQDRKVIPDCFSCGTCMEVCPTKSVSFSKGKRAQVPNGKFT